MFEEIRDMSKDGFPEDTSNVILVFKEALQSTRELLIFESFTWFLLSRVTTTAGGKCSRGRGHIDGPSEEAKIILMWFMLEVVVPYLLQIGGTKPSGRSNYTLMIVLINTKLDLHLQQLTMDSFNMNKMLRMDSCVVGHA
ncbi:hypothetical protein JHK87_055288 [Glycine soja]|nr:hypothetical protein JHK87_055288 [Glycine soja]